MNATVLGAGSWGTALAILLARNGIEVALVGRDEDEMRSMAASRENIRYLPGFAIPQNVRYCALSEVPEQADLWVVAVPAGAVRAMLPNVRGESPLVALASKGIDPTQALLMHELLATHPTTKGARVAALSGPNLAVEIVRGIPTAAVAASPDLEVADRVRAAFSGPTFRVYVSRDLVGVELAGALKNVLAIAAGVSDGLGFGDNSKGALLARGLYEMTKLGLAMGAKLETFMGIAGVGDLFATANSRLSRNYRVGYALGQGQSLHNALDEVGQVAEGVATSECVGVLARRHGVEMPVFEAIELVIRGRIRPLEGVSRLMERLPKEEAILVGPESHLEHRLDVS